MNSVKYNNWKDAVRAHAPGGFDTNAAWEKLQQRNQPSRKKRKWLLWLAAACLCGIALSVFIIKSSNNKPVARKSNMVQPVNNIAAENERAITTGNEAVPAGNEQAEPGKRSSTASTKGVRPMHTKPVENTPVVTMPGSNENKPAPVIIENTPPLIATVQPKEEIKPAAKPAMKIVHLNELDQRQAVMAQQTPPEERTSPKFPLSKPGYAKYNSDEEPQPVIKQRKGFGLPRSLASLKD